MKKTLALALVATVLVLGACSTGSREQMGDNAANRASDEALSRAMQR